MARCGFQKAWTRIQVTAQRRCLPMKHANKADYGSKVDHVPWQESSYKKTAVSKLTVSGNKNSKVMSRAQYYKLCAMYICPVFVMVLCAK